MRKIFALVDCNSFFCSCELLFRPDLQGRPIGVLSNNDGCFVARNKQLKALGVKMGQPYFEVKHLCKRHKVAVFSSNFSLYTNMSDRVMSVLSSFTPNLEVYSVDEAFLDLTGFEKFDLHAYAREIKTTIEKHTGIPVSIGIAPTKTLAKVANHIAKKSDKAQGIVNLMDKRLQDVALSRVPVEDIWGVGRASARKLRLEGVRTAKEFRDFKNDRRILKLLTKTGLARKEELSGLHRFELETVAEDKKQINCSRTFGSAVSDIEALRESLACYVSSACSKLRAQDGVCARVEIYARTSKHRNYNSFYAYNRKSMLSPTSDTIKVIKYALSALDEMYQQGFDYRKAGVRLSGISPREGAQLSLLDEPDSRKTQRLMRCMDLINSRDGRGTLRSAACGVDNSAWAMNRDHKSPRYLTGWSELRKVG